MTNKINGIDVSEYFTNHYDNEGKLYAVEYKGNPLELQNAIKRLEQQIEAYQLSENEADEIMAELEYENKRLQEENEELKEQLEFSRTHKPVLDAERIKYKQALEEIRNIVKPIKENTCFGMYCGAVDWILDEINEALK